MNRKQALILFMIILSGSLVSQETSMPASKRKVASSSVLDSRMFLKEAELIFDTVPEKALDLVHEALMIDIKGNHRRDEADAYRLLGDFNFKLNEYSLSLNNYKKAIIIYDDLSKLSSKRRGESSPVNLYSIYYQAARSAEFVGEYNNSKNYYELFLIEAEKSKFENDIVKAYIGLGNSYLGLNDAVLSKQYYEKALRIEENSGDKSGVAIINMKLWELEESVNNDEKALEYYQISQSNSLDMLDDISVNEAYSNMSNVYRNLNSIEEEIGVSREAIRFNEERDNKGELAKNNIELGMLLMEQDNNEEAIVVLEKSIEITEKTGDIESQSLATEALSKAYEKTGNSKESIKKLKEHISLEDSINKLVKKQLIEEGKRGELLENAQNKLILLEKDKELDEKTIELLRKEKIIQNESMKRQKVISYALLLGFIILFVTAYLVFRSNKERKRANQLLALKSLRTQMNPHFIFNALNSVNSFISNNDERAANRYLSEFSRLMRDVMENSQKDFIPLSKEIDIIELYLKLEHDRFQDKFEYTFDVDKSINQEEYMIPPMLIQPYIENAVWHGLRYRDSKGHLSVDIRKEGKSVVILVEDDGIGRRKSEELKTQNQKTKVSTGIRNIDSRVEIIQDVYKAKIDIKIEDVYDVSGEGTGTRVTVVIQL